MKLLLVDLVILGVAALVFGVFGFGVQATNIITGLSTGRYR